MLCCPAFFYRESSLDALLEPWEEGGTMCLSSADGVCCALLDPATALGLRLGPFCC